MIVRSKTKIRLLILLTGLALLIGSGATVYVIRKHHVETVFKTRRANGIAQYQKGQYEDALVWLAPYVRRQEYANDAEAIYAFAESMKRVEMPGGKNLVQAMGALQRVLSIQPARTDVQRELLDLYTQLGYNIEACELAEKLLAVDKNDLQALRAKARGLAARQLREQAALVCNQINALVPLDLETRVLSLEILRDLNQPQNIFNLGLEIYSRNPNDPRGELILSIACSMMEELTPAQTQKLADLIKGKYPRDPSPRFADPFHFSQFFAIAAAQRELNDLTLVRYLVEQLDRTRLAEASLATLRKVDVQQDDPWIRQSLLHRLWESGRFTDLLKRMEKMQVTGVTPTDIELLAMRGTAQARIDEKEAAAQTATTLAGIKEDRTAQAWAIVLGELFLKQNGDARKSIDSIHFALELQRNNAYLRYFLGMAYLQLGERDSAIDAFSQVTSARPLWQLPLLHRSRLLLEAGQKQSALEDATEAWQINTLALPARSNLAIIAAANTDLSTVDANSDLFRLVAEIRRDFPAEESTLPLWVQLLAKTNQPAEAKKVIDNSLSSSTPPSPATFLRLAAVSRAANLGLDESCLAAAEKSAGLTAEIALARATALAESAKAAEGAKYFQEAMSQHGDDVAWRLGFASYLEQIKDSRAGATWIALADDPALKTNLKVQHEALSAPSTQSDPAFIARAVERIRSVAGEKSIGWKLAQARLQLRDANAGKTENDALIKSLGEIVAAAPSNVDARILLAAAYEKSRNVPVAIEQITAARKLQPASKILSLELARLYTVQLDFQRAREIVEPIPPTSLDPSQRRAAARLIGQQGSISRAIEFMEGAQADAPALDRLYLAELYRRAQQYAKAEAIYKSLLEKPDRLEVIMAAADFYASRGHNELAMQALGNLDKISLKPAEKDFAMAEFSARHGDAEAALSRYLAVVSTDPTKPNGWRSLVSEYIHLGKADEAVQAAKKAMAALPPPSAQPFGNIISSATTLKALVAQPTLVPLITALLEPSPNGEAAAKALPIVAKGIETHASAESIANQLRPIADQAPSLAALQMLLVQNYLICGRSEDAAAIALRSQRISPASPEIARNAALAVFATGRWAQALAPAQQWRELTPGNGLPADLLIAELHLRMEDYAATIRDLQSYVERAKANPKELAPVLIFRAQALLMRGDEAGASDLLGPFLPTQPQIRAAWRDLSTLLPNPLADKWIARLASATPAENINENIDLAAAWHGLYSGRSRFPIGSRDAKHSQAANAILDRLISAAPDNPLVIQARAILAESEKKLGAAEQGYRRALELKQDLPIALNNLAMIVCERGDAKEALSLAQRALSLRPRDPSVHDTLATVQLKLKDLPAAAQSLRIAANLDPRNIDRRIKLAQAYDQAGQMQDLAALMDEIEKMSSDAKLSDTQRDAIRQLRTKVPKTASR